MTHNFDLTHEFDLVINEHITDSQEPVNVSYRDDYYQGKFDALCHFLTSDWFTIARACPITRGKKPNLPRL